MAIKGIPDTENIVLHRVAKNGDSYRITSNEAGTVYTLYKVENDKATKIGKASTPPELEKKYID